MKKFISGIILFAVILSGTALAATSSKQIDVEYGISVIVNGEALIPKDVNGKVVEPFVYDGTTYVPVRAISDALGATVGYDGETNSAVITGKEDKIDHAGEVKDCVERLKIVNEYENLSYEFMISFENLMVITAYYEIIPIADLKMIKAQSRADLNALKTRAASLISTDSDVSYINTSAESILNITDLAIDACIVFASLQNQDTFDKLYDHITSGMEAAFDLNTIAQAELLEIYNEINVISTDGSDDSAITATESTQETT